jgi:hypothetical protein
MNLSREKKREERDQGTFKCIATHLATQNREVCYSNTASKAKIQAVSFARAQSDRLADYKFSEPEEIFKLCSTYQ